LDVSNVSVTTLIPALLWAPACEIVGRRPIFLVALTGFVLVQLMGALGKNAETILIGRFLQGFFGAAPLTTAGGVIADLWGPIGRGPAMSCFS
jgi:DHA1 family multidrug resistance protein-like MFS transporter